MCITDVDVGKPETGLGIHDSDGLGLTKHMCPWYGHTSYASAVARVSLGRGETQEARARRRKS